MASGGDQAPSLKAVTSKGAGLVGVKRNHKQAAMRGKAPKRKYSDFVENTADAGPSSSKDKAKEKSKEKDEAADMLRNRASPARLVALNKLLESEQRCALIDRHFGGLLAIGATTMPADFSQWVMRCYDPEKSELVIPNRGRIPVDSNSVSDMWGLPNSGMKVVWEINADVVKSINADYGFKGSTAPDLTAWCKMIKDTLKGVSGDRFVRAWAVVAFDCFLAPTIGLKVSPRCYLAVSDLDQLERMNISQFVVDQIKQALLGLKNKKKSVCCCVYDLVMRYLDSLVIDELISDGLPRINAWNSDLIKKVIKKDRVAPGVFGKLQLKEKFRDIVQIGLFGGLLKAEQFVSANLPGNFNQNKKRKFGALINGLCSEFEESLARFVQGVGKLEQPTSSGNKNTTDGNEKSKLKKQRTRTGGKESVTADEETSDTDEDGSEDTENEDSDSEDGSGKQKDQDTDEDEQDDDDDDDDGTGNLDEDAREHEENATNNKKDEQKDEEDEDTAADDDLHGESSKKDDHNDGSGGNSDGSGTGGAADSTQDGADETADAAQPGQYYVRIRNKNKQSYIGKDNTKGKTGNNSMAAALGDEYSLFDLCRMEKKSKYPHVPQLELPFIWDDAPSSWSKMYNFDDLIKQSAVSGDKLDELKLHGICSQGTYNEWFEESAGVKKDTKNCSARKTAATVLKEISERRAIARQRGRASSGPDCSENNNTTGEVAEATQFRLQNNATTIFDANPVAHQATSGFFKATSMEQEATYTPFKATNAIIWDESPLSHGRSTSAPFQSKVGSANLENQWSARSVLPDGTCSPCNAGLAVVWDESPASLARSDSIQATVSHNPQRLNTIPSMNMRSNLTVPNKAATANAHTTSCKVQETACMAQASTSSIQATLYTPPTLQNFPPPTPETAKRSVLTSEDLANILKKLTPTSNKVGSSAKSNAAYDQAVPRAGKTRRIGEGYCDPPSFSFGPEFDSPQKPTKNQDAALSTAGDKLLDSLDPVELEITCLEAERLSRLKKQQTFTAIGSESDFETPAKQTIVQTGDSVSDGTDSSSSVNQKHARRIINPPPHMQSYADDGSKKQFVCTTEVNRLYALVILHGGRNTRSKQADNSPPIVNFNDYHVTLKELADSVKPVGCLHTSVMEVGFLAISNNLPASSSKIIMPLRIATRFQQLQSSGAEMNKLFTTERRLDKKDMVMLPVVEVLDPKAAEPANHYWLFNINIRDKKFEVLDSLRTLKDRSLKNCALKIISSIRSIWDDNYSKSKVQL